MFARLMRDPVTRALPRWILATFLIASVLEGTRSLALFNARRAGEGWLNDPYLALFVLAMVLWLPLAGCLAYGGAGRRCWPLELALPVSARKLWLTHLVALIAGGSVVLFFVAFAAILKSSLLDAVRSGEVAGPGPLRLILPLAAVTLLVAVLVQSYRPSRDVYPGRRSLLVVACIVGPSALVAVLILLPWYVSLIPPALALVIGARAYRSLPAALSIAPREAAAAEVVRAMPSPTDGARSPGSLTGTLFRVLAQGIGSVQLIKLPFTLLIGYPFLILFGILLSGAWVVEEGFEFALLTAYLLFCLLPGPLAQVPLLDPLPVSRRRIAVLLILAPLVAVAVGYGLGDIAGRTLEQPTDRVLFNEGRSGYNVRVPIERMRIAWDGTPPANHAPWGETQTGWSAPLFRGSRITLYSPFSAPEGSSVEFVALQISRAVEAVYGHSLEPREIQGRYLRVDGSGKVVPAGDGLTLVEDYGLRPRKARPLFPLVITVVGFFYFLWASLYLQFFRATISEGFRKGLFFALLGVALAVHLVQLGLSIAGIARTEIIGGFAEILAARFVANTPGGSILVWGVCAAVLVAAYLVTESRFRKIEVLPVPGGGF